MSKCENCIHYDACEDWANIDNLNKLGFPFECEGDTKPCAFYKDKTLFVELPCKVGDTLYFGNYKGEVVENEILDIRYRTKTKSGFYNDISIDKVGKTVYVTRQEGQAEAERKLREVGE